MPQQDTSILKEKIYSLIRRKGPSLPVHVAKETGLSILFSSVFLSELISENKIKTSNMKVGSSPLYFIPGQEPILENFSAHLKSKEKDAFILLKERKFLKDKEQEPAIRVALRQIKDFAVAFKKGDEIFWRYFTVPESELKIPQKQTPLVKQPLRIESSPEPVSKIKKLPEPTPKKQTKTLDIFDREKPKMKKRVLKKIRSTKKEDKLFNDIKEYLLKKQIEILGIESIAKNELRLKVKENNQEYLLVALNKKKIDEKDIINAHKKSLESNMKFRLLSFGEPLKKLNELLKAFGNIYSIDKIEK